MGKPTYKVGNFIEHADEMTIGETYRWRGSPVILVEKRTHYRIIGKMKNGSLKLFTVGQLRYNMPVSTENDDAKI